MSEQTTETNAADVLDGRASLVLSPHMDDAMLSAAAIVLETPAQVWTLFTGDPIPPQTTSWDLSCGFADSHETITARRLEDLAAFEGTPSTLRHLDAWEGAYATPTQRRSDMPMLRAEITAWLEENPEGVLVLPVCAGLHVPTPWWAGLQTRLEKSKENDVSPEAQDASGVIARIKPLFRLGQRKAKGALGRAMHIDTQRRRRKVIGTSGLAANPDHVTVRDLGLELANNFPGVQVLFFEDLPYLWHERGDASAERLERRGLTLEKVRISVDADAKFTHLQKYTSQMPVMDSDGRLMQRNFIESYENYWALKR